MLLRYAAPHIVVDAVVTAMFIAITQRHFDACRRAAAMPPYMLQRAATSWLLDAAYADVMSLLQSALYTRCLLLLIEDYYCRRHFSFACLLLFIGFPCRHFSYAAFFDDFAPLLRCLR